MVVEPIINYKACQKRARALSDAGEALCSTEGDQKCVDGQCTACSVKKEGMCLVIRKGFNFGLSQGLSKLVWTLISYAL